jgi:hypothetical protein
MTENTYQISLNFEQILELVKQLPQEDKLRLSKELEESACDRKFTELKELEESACDRKFTELLEAFQANEIDLATINQEVETVRAELYSRQESN